MEVDFVLYGHRGLKAFEIKRRRKIFSKMLTGLKAFIKDYPESETYFIYGGDRQMSYGKINAIPFAETLKNLHKIL